MSIAGIFNNMNNVKYSENSADAISKSSQNNSQSNASLEPGTSVTGKVMSVNAKEGSVTVDIAGKTINAKLEGNVSLKPGETVTFDVKGNSGNQLTLSPLYTNTANTSTAIKALSFANIPITENSIQMADTMINQNMKIDSASLSMMYRQVAANPETAPAVIVEMKNFGIEINPDNIESFQAFKNYENQVTSGMNEIMDSMPEAFKELASKGDNVQFTNFALDVINTFNGDSSSASSGVNENIEFANINDIQNKTVITDNLASQNSVDQNSISQNSTNQNSVADTLIKDASERLDNTKSDVLNLVGDKNTSTALFSDADNMTNALIGDGAEENSLESLENSVTKALNSESILSGKLADGTEVSLTDNLNNKDAWQSMTTFEKSNMIDVLKQAGLDNETAMKLLQENSTNKDFLDATKTLLEKGKLTDSMKDMISSDKFGNILKSQMQNQWLLSPIDVGQKETVENLYRRLNEQTKELTESLSNNALQNTSLASNLSDMNNNLDFMNQMNNMYQYVQLPLKMAGSEATGDLFVYTDKKSLARKDGNVSALLHLDMDHLGPIDVYASITPGNNVYTKFYVENDEMLDFIEANINILNDRLEKRGYSMKCETVTRDKADNIVPGVSANGNADNTNMANAKKIMKYSFDMKA